MLFVIDDEVDEVLDKLISLKSTDNFSKSAAVVFLNVHRNGLAVVLSLLDREIIDQTLR
ncbi:MAG: ATP-dependent Clp protease adapter protein ClpS [Shewanella sp.]|jgi:ATP-dependent Clp protease adapter protein ClpS